MKTENLETARFENAKKILEIVKKLFPSNPLKRFNSEHFAEYFKVINNSESRFCFSLMVMFCFSMRYVHGELGIMFQELDVSIGLNEIRKAVLLPSFFIK